VWSSAQQSTIASRLDVVLADMPPEAARELAAARSFLAQF
jgi:hypothetical protein